MDVLHYTCETFMFSSVAFSGFQAEQMTSSHKATEDPDESQASDTSQFDLIGRVCVYVCGERGWREECLSA